MNSAKIIKQLEKAGWTLRAVKSSHHIYTHPDKGGHISVSPPKKDMGTGLVNKLLKQAGVRCSQSRTTFSAEIQISMEFSGII